MLRMEYEKKRSKILCSCPSYMLAWRKSARVLRENKRYQPARDRAEYPVRATRKTPTYAGGKVPTYLYAQLGNRPPLPPGRSRVARTRNQETLAGGAN
jgi:hypothetical protein